MRTLVINKSHVVNDGSNSRFRYNFLTNVKFNEGDKIALAVANIPYSWFNIHSQKYNNTSYSIIYNNTTYNLVMPNGFYTLIDMNYYLQQFLITNNLYLVNSSGDYVYFLEWQTNPNYYAIQLNSYPVPSVLPSGWTNPGSMTLNGYCPQVQILSTNKFNLVVGFNSGLYPSTSTVSTKQSFLSSFTPVPSPVSSFLINCSIVNQSSISLNSSSAIYSFTPNVDFGNNIIIEPQNLITIDVNYGFYQSIDIFMTDQDNNPLVMMDPNVLILIVIKSKGE
jgi:hypothetical protein